MGIPSLIIFQKFQKNHEVTNERSVAYNRQVVRKYFVAKKKLFSQEPKKNLT